MGTIVLCMISTCMLYNNRDGGREKFNRMYDVRAVMTE